MKLNLRPTISKLPAAFISGPAIFLLPTLTAATEAGGETTTLLTGNQETLSLSTALFKTLGSLVVVVGLMLLLLYFIRKAGLAQGSMRQSGLINIIDTKMVAPKKQVAILKIGEEYIAVGITDQNINLLTKLDHPEAIEKNIDSTHPAKESTPFSFASVLSKTLQNRKNTKQDR